MPTSPRLQPRMERQRKRVLLDALDADTAQRLVNEEFQRTGRVEIRFRTPQPAAWITKQEDENG